MNWLKRLLYKSPIVITLIFLAVTASYCTYPLFVSLTLPFAHDIVFHIFETEQLNHSLQNIVFYPRWIPDVNTGYGSLLAVGTIDMTSTNIGDEIEIARVS